MGQATPAVLEAMGVVVHKAASAEAVAPVLDAAARIAFGSYAAVAVLGQTVAAELYAPNVDPVGRYVWINNIPFQVIGVMTRKGANTDGDDMDDTLFIPITTGKMRLFGRNYVRTILVRIDEPAQMDSTMKTIETLLTARHMQRDFKIKNMSELLDTAEDTQNTLTLLLGSIAAISLLVGGIGVMNIMLVSVTERIREIGLRMAAGARRLHILLQFNIEALVVCSIGGLLGVAAGLAVAHAAAALGRPVVFAVAPILLAFGSAFVTGLVFGFLPARKAAAMDPVTALATE